MSEITLLERRLEVLEKRLTGTEQALLHLMVFTGLIRNSPVTPEEEAWAREVFSEGRHLQPSKPLKREEQG